MKITVTFDSLEEFMKHMKTETKVDPVVEKEKEVAGALCGI
nr:MAG TPA: hypothetical protein [Caudoviricetes sp.]